MTGDDGGRAPTGAQPVRSPVPGTHASPVSDPGAPSHVAGQLCPLEHPTPGVMTVRLPDWRDASVVEDVPNGTLCLLLWPVEGSFHPDSWQVMAATGHVGLAWGTEIGAPVGKGTA